MGLIFLLHIVAGEVWAGGWEQVVIILSHSFEVSEMIFAGPAERITPV